MSVLRASRGDMGSVLRASRVVSVLRADEICVCASRSGNQTSLALAGTCETDWECEHDSKRWQTLLHPESGSLGK